MHIKTLLLLSLFCARAVWADDMPQNQYQFSVQVQEEVENDTLTLRLGARAQNADLRTANKQVSEDIKRILAEISKNKDLQPQLLAMQSQPVYHEGSIKNWLVSQSILLKSKQFSSVLGTVEKLKPQLDQMELNFSVSPELQKKTEDALLKKALIAFKERAALIAETMDTSRYNIGQVSVDNNLQYAPVARPRMLLMEAKMGGSDAPVGEGKSTISMNVSGNITLE
jgi:predicted secreted protein